MLCAKRAVENAQQRCQSIPGGSVDQAVGKVLVESVTPLALEVALKLQEELQGRLEQADRLRQQQVQRAQYEADQARNPSICLNFLAQPQCSLWRLKAK